MSVCLTTKENFIWYIVVDTDIDVYAFLLFKGVCFILSVTFTFEIHRKNICKKNKWKQIYM